MSEALEKFTPKEIIRTETALSRFPVHRLSKKGSISISIKVAKPNGELKTQWKVSHNSEYGQPSPLAYKLDTLIINRRIEVIHVEPALAHHLFDIAIGKLVAAVPADAE